MNNTCKYYEILDQNCSLGFGMKENKFVIKLNDGSNYSEILLGEIKNGNYLIKESFEEHLFESEKNYSLITQGICGYLRKDILNLIKNNKPKFNIKKLEEALIEHFEKSFNETLELN